LRICLQGWGQSLSISSIMLNWKRKV